MVKLVKDGEAREAHDGVLRPDILARYVQLTFYGAVLGLVLVIMVKFMLVVREDVQCKVRERLASGLRSVAECKRSYEQNGCLPGMRVPALEESCDQWFHCMNQDADWLKHGSGSGALWAKTMGEILNSFVEPISMRSAFLMLFVVCAVVLVTNMAFGSYRVYYYNDSGRQVSQQ